MLKGLLAGRAGEEVHHSAGNRQRATDNPDEYTFDHISTMVNIGHGIHLHRHPSLCRRCAADHWVRAGTKSPTRPNTFANQDRLKLHTQKTCVNAFRITQTEMEHLESSHPWAINGEPVPVGWEFTHLGINYLSSFNITASTTVDARLNLAGTLLMLSWVQGSMA